MSNPRPLLSIIALSLFATLAFGGLCAAEEAPPAPRLVTLEDAFERAVATSETLKRFDEEIEIAEARYREARAAYLPHLSLVANERVRNSETFGVYGGASGSDSEGTSGSRPGRKRDEFETILRIEQTLFSGFREQLYADAARTRGEATALDRARAREELFLSVAELYYDLSRFERDEVILAKAIEVIDQRITELDRFIELGRSRRSEVLSAQSERADLGATLESTRGLAHATRELFAFLVALPSDNFLIETPKPRIALPLDSYLDRAVGRSDIAAEQVRAEALNYELTATQRERWGALGIEGSAYGYEDPERNRDWELLLQYQVPLFEGGAIDARVAAREGALRSQKLLVEQRRRLAERDVRRFYAEHTAAAREVERLKVSTDLAIKNFEAQQRDYALGVVTNLEVLAALRNAEDARRRLLEAETRAALSLVRVEVAAGSLT